MQSTTEHRSTSFEIRHQQGIDIHAVCFSADGEQVFSGGNEGILRRWRVSDGQEVEEASIRAGDRIYAIAMSPDRRRLACGLFMSHPNVKVWDVETHEMVLQLDQGSVEVTSLDISSDATKIATAGFQESLVSIWSMTTGDQLVGPLRLTTDLVRAVRFSPGGDRLAAADPVSICIYKSDDGQRILVIPCSFGYWLSSPIVWSTDGSRIFSSSQDTFKCFDASSGSLLSSWPVPGDAGLQSGSSISLSRNRRFFAIVVKETLSFWDASTLLQIGPVIRHKSYPYSIALSPADDRIASGEMNGTITLRSLRGVLPSPYISADVSFNFIVQTGESKWLCSARFLFFHLPQLPFMNIGHDLLELWLHGDLAGLQQSVTDQILHPIDSFHHSHALAHRSLIRSRSEQYDLAIEDAKKSTELERSVIGYIALAKALVGNGRQDAAIRILDLAFGDGLSTENNFLLLIKAILLFECGKDNDAVLRIGDLINIVDDKSVYIAVRAQLFLLLGGRLLRMGDGKEAVEMLMCAREAIPIQKSRHLTTISLIFGWDFESLAVTIRQNLQQCIKPLEDLGDMAMLSKNPEDAVAQYSIALSLGPSDPASLFVKRSRAQAMLTSWDEALKDADEAIRADPQSPWGYERRHTALHALKRFDEAADAVNLIISLTKMSAEHDVRQLGERYVSLAQLVTSINNAVHDVFKTCPLILIDVRSGRLCDAPQRMDIFKAEPQFKEIISSMTLKLADGRIPQVVNKYFRYVTFSHVWEGKEPSYQDVQLAGSVWHLDASPLNDKLRSFCKVVREDGYRWAWSDTCCIDKTTSTVLHQSLKMMYKWYEASVATFVFLADVDTVLEIGSLTDSKWMTRAWTSQELLVPIVIRFYDRNWKPYRGDTHSNHKESPEILQELTQAIGITQESITKFNPDDISVREKLRLASTRNATVEEDVAYSLIGVFKSDIRPEYGEGDAALGHLLEEIVARSADVTVLAWAGRSSSYNSSLPSTLSVFDKKPVSLMEFEDAEMDRNVAALRNSLSQADVMSLHTQITCLPPARFANRRLHLPSIIFPVKRLGVQAFVTAQENHYRARISGIGYVEFHTSDRLTVNEPRKLVLVHPWIRDLCDPHDGFAWGSMSDDESESDSDAEDSGGSAPNSPLRVVPTDTMDTYTRALRFVVRLQRPFQALLLEQQPTGEFKRVAAEHEIIVAGIDQKIKFAKDIHAGVLEIL